MIHHCRHCGARLCERVIDLGHQPPSNHYLTMAQLSLPEVTYPLLVFVCTECWLMQLPDHAGAEQLFTAEYPYFSSVSSSWCAHAERFVAEAVKRLGLDRQSLVLEVASNDGYLLQYVMRSGIPCLGIEPTAATAAAAIARGIPTIERFFGLALANELVLSQAPAAGGADLVVANNVLAHVPEINDFLAGIARILKPHGMASLEFPHLLALLAGTQFDTIYHEHYSYLSLRVVQKIADAAGLDVVDVEALNTHGGSLRVWLGHRHRFQPTAAVEAVLDQEDRAGLQSMRAYADFQQRAVAAKNGLLEFLLAARRAGRQVLAYGAAAKGNTLLNYAGVRQDLIAAVADKATSKQGKFLPGSHLPVISPEQLAERDVDDLLILPWNLIEELKRQFPGRSLITAIPQLTRW